MLILKDIVKDYEAGDTTVRALKGVSINFRESEFVSILGPSGCGKTTMLNLIGGLDRYTSGDLIINGKSTMEFTDGDWRTRTGTPTATTPSASSSSPITSSRTRPCWPTWSWR